VLWEPSREARRVVPLHNLNIPRTSRIPFGKFTIQDVPAWLDKDGILKDLTRHDRVGVKHVSQPLPGSPGRSATALRE
jgi:hypothetical protein